MTLTVRGVSNKHCLLTFFIDTNSDTDTDRVEVRRIKMLSKLKNKGSSIVLIMQYHSHACMGEVFRIFTEFRILRLTFHRKSASKC